MSAPVPRNFQADNAENLEDLEKQFAVKAVMHMKTYWDILEKLPASSLRLTPVDDEIYEHLLRDFPELTDGNKVKVVDEDEMKSAKNKPRWRNFMNEYEERVDDYNFGTMLRKDAGGEYSEDNSIFVPRMQFYAIEIYRNKHGMNDWIKEQA